MADIRAPPMSASAAKDAAKGLFSNLKSKIPSNLPTAGPSEKLQFAKHARGRDGGALNASTSGAGGDQQYPQAGEMEMQPVNSGELPDYNSVNQEGYQAGYTEGYSGEYVEGGTGAGMGVDLPENLGGGGGRPLPRGESTWSASTAAPKEGSSHDMITQWQAGWNVTNAIQV